MKNRKLVDWKILAFCMAASAAIAGLVHIFAGFSFWITWTVVIAAWLLVGLSTLADD